MLEQTINKNKNDIKGSQHDVKKKMKKKRKRSTSTNGHLR